MNDGYIRGKGSLVGLCMLLQTPRRSLESIFRSFTEGPCEIPRDEAHSLPVPPSQHRQTVAGRFVFQLVRRRLRLRLRRNHLRPFPPSQFLVLPRQHHLLQQYLNEEE